jgi:hypothetical protein
MLFPDNSLHEVSSIELYFSLVFLKHFPLVNFDVSLTVAELFRHS